MQLNYSGNNVYILINYYWKLSDGRLIEFTKNGHYQERLHADKAEIYTNDEGLMKLFIDGQEQDLIVTLFNSDDANSLFIDAIIGHD